MSKFFNIADIFLVSLKKGEAFSKTLPAKIQSYLYAGKPILAHVSGESAEILNNSKSAFVSNPGDLKSFEENVIKFYNANNSSLLKMSNNARKFYDANFNQIKLFNNFLNFINIKNL